MVRTLGEKAGYGDVFAGEVRRDYPWLGHGDIVRYYTTRSMSPRLCVIVDDEMGRSAIPLATAHEHLWIHPRVSLGIDNPIAFYSDFFRSTGNSGVVSLFADRHRLLIQAMTGVGDRDAVALWPGGGQPPIISVM